MRKEGKKEMESKREKGRQNGRESEAKKESKSLGNTWFFPGEFFQLRRLLHFSVPVIICLWVFFFPWRKILFLDHFPIFGFFLHLCPAYSLADLSLKANDYHLYLIKSQVQVWHTEWINHGKHVVSEISRYVSLTKDFSVSFGRRPLNMWSSKKRWAMALGSTFGKHLPHY